MGDLGPKGAVKRWVEDGIGLAARDAYWVEGPYVYE